MKKFLTQSAFAAVAIFTAFFVLACDDGNGGGGGNELKGANVLAGDVVIWYPLKDRGVEVTAGAQPQILRVAQDYSLPTPTFGYYESAYDLIEAKDIVYADEGVIAKVTENGVYSARAVVKASNGAAITLDATDWFAVTGASADTPFAITSGTTANNNAGYVLTGPYDNVKKTNDSGVISLYTDSSHDTEIWYTKAVSGSSGDGFKTLSSGELTISGQNNAFFYLYAAPAGVKYTASGDDGVFDGLIISANKFYNVKIVDSVEIEDGALVPTLETYVIKASAASKIAIPTATAYAAAEIIADADQNLYYAASSASTTITTTAAHIYYVKSVGLTDGSANEGYEWASSASTSITTVSGAVYKVTDETDNFQHIDLTAAASVSAGNWPITGAEEGDTVFVFVQKAAANTLDDGSVGAEVTVAADGKILKGDIETATSARLADGQKLHVIKTADAPAAAPADKYTIDTDKKFTTEVDEASAGDLVYIANGGNGATGANYYRVLVSDRKPVIAGGTSGHKYNVRKVADAANFKLF